MPGVGEKPVFPIEACGVHRQSHTGKGTWLQSSGHCAQAVATSWASLRCLGIFLLSFLWTHPVPADRPGSGDLVPSPSN